MLNNLSLIGRIGSEPELKQTTAGKNICTFRLAAQRTWNREVTDWFTVVCWGKTAEFVSSYMGKGRMIALTGAIQTREYTDREGNRRTAFEVVADNAFFVEGKGQERTGPGVSQGPKSVAVEAFEEVDPGRLPF